MANRAAILKVWGDAVFDLLGFAHAIYPPSCDSDNAGGSICSQGRSSCRSTAGLMGAWGSHGLGHWSLGTALPHAWLQQESHLWGGSALA